jgi:hypothetical protein
MAEVVTWVLVSAALFVTIGVALTATTLWRLRRRNRIHRSLPTTAPLWWLGSPMRAPRLHRRLRAAIAASGWEGRRRSRRRRIPVDAGEERLQELAGDLAGEALAIDHALVAAALAPKRSRRHILDTIEPSVVRLERVAGRLAALRVGAGARLLTDPACLDALEEQLDALEAARLEVDELEALLRVPGDPFASRRLDRPA